MAYFFMKNWETFKGSTFHFKLSERWLCKMLKGQLMWKAPVMFGSQQRFSTIQRPGNENSRGPATERSSQALCAPPNESPFSFWSLHFPKGRNGLITRIPFGNNSHVPRAWGSAFGGWVGGLIDWMDIWVIFLSFLSLKTPAGMLGALGLASPIPSRFP